MKYSDKLHKIITNDCSIIGKEKFLNSAVIIPIININNNEYILFQKRSATVRQPGEVSFPGGHINSLLDKDYLATAIRETCEELGITKDKINVIGRLGTLVAPMGVIVETFIGYLNINNLEELNIDSNEVERIFILPLEYFVKNDPEEYFTRLELYPFALDANGERQELLPVNELGLPERYASPWVNCKHRVFVYRTSEEVIWGITAELIYELSKKLRD